MSEVFDCPRCDGGGEVRRYFPRPTHLVTCDVCDGSGRVAVDPEAIRMAIVVTRGPRKDKLLRSPSDLMRSVYGAQYVWRIARFNGGADLNLPVMAYDTLGVHGLVTDACKVLTRRLDELADEVAVEEFGTTMAAARAWGRVLA